MGLFGELDEDDIRDSDSSGKDGSAAGVGITLAVLFLPAIIPAFFIYMMLRKGRQRLSVIFLVVALLEGLLFLLWGMTGAFDKLKDLAGDPSTIASDWKNVLPALTIFYSSIGFLMGLGFSLVEVRRMKNEPHRLSVRGGWMYKFKYRRTPWEYLRRKKNIESLKKGIMVDAEKIPLGLDEKNDDSIAFRYYDESFTHMLITGGTGSGKTRFGMLPLVRGDIENQESMIFMDFKNDPELASKLATWTKENNGKFYHFVKGDTEEYDIPNSQGQSYYDPLASAGPTAKAGMLLGMREYDVNAEVYKNAMQELLSVLMPALEIVRQKRLRASEAELNDPKNAEKFASKLNWNNGNIYLVASVLKGEGLTDLAIACSGMKVKNHENIVESINDYATLARTKKTHQEHAVNTLAAQMRTMIASECGRWLRTSPGAHTIDLYELTRNPGNVILFSFDSESEEDFAKNFGSLVFADIANVSAKRRNNGDGNFVGVYADEFQVVPPTAVKGLLEKARGSNMAVTLSLQSLEQIVIAGGSDGEAHLKSMLDNCGNFIVFDGTQEDSAERYSKILGKHWVTSYKASNVNKSFAFSVNFANKREAVVQTLEEEKWVFEPREFLSLTRANKNDPKSKTTAIIINKSSFDPRYAGSEGATARRVWMIPNQENFQDYYRPSRRRLNGPEIAKPVVVEPEEGFEEIVPQDYNYLEAKKNAVTREFPATYADDAFEQVRDFRDFNEPEENEEFFWEEVEDEKEEDELKSIVAEMVEEATLPQRPSVRPEHILPPPPPVSTPARKPGGLPVAALKTSIPVSQPEEPKTSRRRASSFKTSLGEQVLPQAPAPQKSSDNSDIDYDPDDMQLPGL